MTLALQILSLFVLFAVIVRAVAWLLLDREEAAPLLADGAPEVVTDPVTAESPLRLRLAVARTELLLETGREPGTRAIWERHDVMFPEAKVTDPVIGWEH